MDRVFDTPYLIELLTPRSSSERIETELESFVERYSRIVRSGAGVSIPDNPMGNRHLSVFEVVDRARLPLAAERTLLHLNSFHDKREMDQLLRAAADRGMAKILVVGGDGNESLPRLQPSDIGVSASAVTSAHLLDYIQREFADIFECGAAFNQYGDQQREHARLKSKTDAGARFIITQPALNEDPALAPLRTIALPVFVGVWMSRRIDLLMQCVGGTCGGDDDYDPAKGLARIERAYPDYGLYLALLSFKQDWTGLLTRLTA